MCVHMFTQDMENITLTIPEELKKELRKHEEVNWSAVIRKALQEHLRRIRIAETIANRSKLTKKDADEIARKIDASIAKKLGLK